MERRYSMTNVIISRHPATNVIISRHPATTEFILKTAGLPSDTPVIIGNAAPDDIRGKTVFGNLPLHLAALAEMVIAVEFAGTPPRVAEYTLSDMLNAGAYLAPYRVHAVKGAVGVIDGSNVTTIDGNPPKRQSCRMCGAKGYHVWEQDNPTVSPRWWTCLHCGDMGLGIHYEEDADAVR
jgi:hypothetical protein